MDKLEEFRDRVKVIYVNGKKRLVDFDEMAYELLAQLAYPGYTGGVLTAVYYWKGPGDLRRQGILSPGRGVKIDDEMIFSIVDTSNA
jgi:hypothetical protein